MGKGTKGTKKGSGKQAGNKRALWVALFVAGAILLVVGGIFSYRKARHAAAPVEIKLIRSLPIYNYESDTLKIVSRSEDYGGYDWKHVYNEPSAHISFNSQFPEYNSIRCKQEIADYLKDSGWSQSINKGALAQKYQTMAFEKSIQNDQYRATVWPGDFKGELCYIIVAKK